MADLDAIEQAAIARLKTVSELADVLDHEPDSLPLRLPIVTLLGSGFAYPRRGKELAGYRRSLGRRIEFEYRWSVHVYVSTDGGVRVAQRELFRLLPKLALAIIADDRLADTCMEAALVDPGDDPIHAEDDRERWLLKELTLSVYAHEVIG